MYNVHMKHVKASEARRRWFQLLDDVIAGEEIMIERRGQRIVIRAEGQIAEGGAVPDYSEVLKAPCVDDADQWSWDWSEDGTLRLSDPAERGPKR